MLLKNRKIIFTIHDFSIFFSHRSLRKTILKFRINIFNKTAPSLLHELQLWYIKLGVYKPIGVFCIITVRLMSSEGGNIILGVEKKTRITSKNSSLKLESNGFKL